MPMRRRPAATAIVLALTASACTHAATPTSTPSPVPVKIAFLQDMTVPGATQVVTPSFLGLQLALTEAVDRGGLPVIPELVGLDTHGDPAEAADLARQIADDPTYAAVVVAPFVSESEQVGTILSNAGIATFSLSDLDPSLAEHGWASWRRVVAGLGREAESLAAAVRGSPRSVTGVCLVGDGTPYATALAANLARELGPGLAAASLVVADGSALAGAVERVRRVGCGAVAWTGFAPGATLVRTGLTDGGLGSVPMLGSDAMKADTYLSSTAGAADGTVVTCACVDLASSTRPEARRFIHDFQSAYGAPPGVLGAEAWDVGGMLLRTFATGAVGSRAVAVSLASAGPYDGLATTYRFDATGELVPGQTPIHLFRAEGLRWVPIGEADARGDLPVETPGYLSVSSCRTGRPFAYQQRGRLRGFDVELAAAVARRLGLTLAWSDRPCASAMAAVEKGVLDAVIAATTQVAQGTPTSRIALSLHVAVVAKRAAAHPGRPFLSGLHAGDVVAVVRSPEALNWRRTAHVPSGVVFRTVASRSQAYGGLVRGRFTAVADLEPDAWTSIERRPSLAVVQSIDAGVHDVFAAAGPDTALIAAIDAALGRVIEDGKYTLLFAEYFPGTPIPKETGT